MKNSLIHCYRKFVKHLMNSITYFHYCTQSEIDELSIAWFHQSQIIKFHECYCLFHWFIHLFRTRIFDLSPNYLCCASGKISWQIQRFFYHHMSWSKNSWKIGVGDCLWLTPQQEATDSLLQSVFVQFSHLVKQCHEQIKSFLTRMNPWIDMF